jgi:hypothetical protein
LLLSPLGLLASLLEYLLDRIAPQPKPRLGIQAEDNLLPFHAPSAAPRSARQAILA